MKGRVLGKEAPSKVASVALTVSVVGREDRVLEGEAGISVVALLRSLPYARPCLDQSCDLCAVEVMDATGLSGLSGEGPQRACALRIDGSGGHLRLLWPYSMEAIYGAD